MRVHVEAPYGLHLVAKEIDAHGLLRFRGKHVQNSAAYGVLADHFDGLAPLVADALQVGDHFFEWQLLSGTDAEGELAVVVGGFDAQ